MLCIGAMLNGFMQVSRRHQHAGLAGIVMLEGEETKAERAFSFGFLKAGIKYAVV